MRIGIDISQIRVGESGGVVPHLAGVLDRLFAGNPHHEFIVYRSIFNRSIVEERANVRMVVLPFDDPWRHLQASSDSNPLDVLFRAFPTPDDLVFPLHRQVVLIVDLQHEDYPQFFSTDFLQSRKLAFGKALRDAGAIGTISEFAKRRILASPDHACTDVFLMPPALRRLAAPTAADSEIAKRLSAIGPYFYYPANLWRHKNHERVIAAFGMFRKHSRRDIAFVFTGNPAGWDRLSRRFPDLPLHHLGFVTESDQQAIYRCALATTFFSLYEGFGMPLLEAFAADCPVICSNTTSLPEVGDGAIMSCSPTDVSAMAGLMNQITASEPLRHSLIIAGRERLKQFSWDRSASELMAALTRVATKNHSLPLPETPLVSIVTPSFNQAAFLRRTIESVLSQTYRNIEYVVMDGGSTDGSVDILRSYGDRIRWLSERDRGQAHAINKGFALCRGQIRGYLNSDDTLQPDAIEKVVRFFADNPRYDMVYGDANYIDKEDHVTGKYNTADYTFARLMQDCCVCQPAAFWRDRTAAAVGPFDESLDIVMDYDYWLRIARSGSHIKHLPEVLANSRRYLETKTLSRREDVYAEIFEVCARHGGYVAPGYFYGLWEHRLRERNIFVRNSLGRVPKLPSIMARAHQAWFYRHETRQRLKPAIRRFLRRLKRRLAGIYVYGIWADSWVAPRAAVATTSIGEKASLFFSGWPACDGFVAVSAEGKTLVQSTLRKGHKATIEFPSRGQTPVELRFSCSTIDEQGRRVSFRLDATNLLRETDL